MHSTANNRDPNRDPRFLGCHAGMAKVHKVPLSEWESNGVPDGI
jgi:hypothetical protein